MTRVKPILIGFLAALSISLYGCNFETLPSGATVIADRTPSDIRQVFIFLPEDKFDAETIELLFAFYRPQCVPQGLEVVVFSSRELLEERIKHPISDYTIDFASDENGRKAAKEHAQRIYRPEGTFVASYSRFLFNENYEYRLSKENIPPTVVTFDPSENPYRCACEGNR